MPLLYQQDINDLCRLGVWDITEGEDFFLAEVMLQRSITAPHKRLQHLAGRYLLRVLFPDFPAHLIRIADTRKPFLEDEAFHFSISHCRNLAAVLISREERVGVDVELVSEKVALVKHKFLTETEDAMLLQLAAGSRQRYAQSLTAAWSIKEALFKWYGLGQIDFKKHLRINSIKADEMAGVAQCRFEKDSSRALQVHFKFLEDYCLSWVMSAP